MLGGLPSGSVKRTRAPPCSPFAALINRHASTIALQIAQSEPDTWSSSDSGLAAHQHLEHRDPVIRSEPFAAVATVTPSTPSRLAASIVTPAPGGEYLAAFSSRLQNTRSSTPRRTRLVAPLGQRHLDPVLGERPPEQLDARPMTSSNRAATPSAGHVAGVQARHVEQIATRPAMRSAWSRIATAVSSATAPSGGRLMVSGSAGRRARPAACASHARAPRGLELRRRAPTLTAPCAPCATLT